MVHTFIPKLTRIPYLLPLIFVAMFLIPFPAIAESETPSCTDTKKQIEHTQLTLRPLQQQQQQIQQRVRTVYQELFACKTDSELSLTQGKYCSQLEEEGPKQFQAMVEAITLSHQASQQLAEQTRQAQLTCPTLAEDTFRKTTSLSSHPKIAMNN